MPDLHVVSLRYVLRPSADVSFTNPPPVEFETNEARFRLADGTLTCEMKTHFADPAEARRAVEPAIRAWEVDAELRLGRSGLRFDLEGAEVIDRAPALPGAVNANAFIVGSQIVTMSGTVSVHISNTAYPTPPPPAFRLSPDAESILARYQGYRDGREPILSMAYFCLTLLETKGGGITGTSAKTDRERAALSYGIELPVLKKMGELTSTRGDAMNARKADATKSLTGEEHAWLEAAVKMLVWRLGDIRPASALPVIKLSDLPKL